MTQEELSVNTLRAIADAFNRHDLDEVMEYFTDDAVFESPRGPSPGVADSRGRQRSGRVWRPDSAASPTSTTGTTSTSSRADAARRNGP